MMKIGSMPSKRKKSSCNTTDRSLLKLPTLLERFSGHSTTEGALTLVSALAGSPLAALLPVLSNTLAGERHQQRVRAAFDQVNATLNEHSEALRNISDSQYQLINETILALLNTTSAEKIEYLRRAINNTLMDSSSSIQPQESAVLARAIRDISADEADFLTKNFHHDRIKLSFYSTNDSTLKILTVPPESRDGLVVTGLVSMGLLTAGEPTWGDSDLLRFSPIVAKILVLLRDPSSSPAP
jgi:hypothetical protein